MKPPPPRLTVAPRGGAEAKAARLLEAARVFDELGFAERLRWWHHLAGSLAAAEGRSRLRSRLRLGLAMAVCALALGLLAWQVGWLGGGPVASLRSIDLGQVGLLELDSDAQVRLSPGIAAGTPAPPRIYLDAGQLVARIRHRAPGRPLEVVTPHLRVVVVGTRFRVRVEPLVSTVAVEEGKVRVEAPHAPPLVLAPGEQVASDDPRLRATIQVIAPRPPAPQPAPPPQLAPAPLPPPVTVNIQVPGCGGERTSAERLRCYQRAARGRNLAAENALVALAIFERDQRHDSAAAIERWRRYLERFPDGVFRREATLAMLLELAATRPAAEVLPLADRFLTLFPDDPQRLAVLALRERLIAAP